MDTKLLLKKLISFPTVSVDVMENEKALTFSKNYLEKKGILGKLVQVEGHGILYWGANPKSAKYMINSHIDVVPGDRAMFKSEIKGNFVTGRGSLDTKSSVAVMLSLEKKVVDMAASKGVIFVLVSDEEIGGVSSREFINGMTNLEWALFLEPTNMKIINEAKGIMQIKITFTGKSAHGSKPWEGMNAITHMTEKLNAFIAENKSPVEETKETTFNFAQITGGTAINQIPANCELFVDVRYNPLDNPRKILSKLKKKFKGCSVEALKVESAIISSKDNPKTLLLSESIKRCGLEVCFTFDHASSDARHCTKNGVPAVIFGPTGEGQHQDKEMVNMRSVDVLHNIIKDLLARL